MTEFKCKTCGGNLIFDEGATTVECDYCGNKQTLPKLSNDRRISLYGRANHYRRNNEFDKATGIYEQLLDEDSTDAEAYWSLVLCRYGIEYIEDSSNNKRLPTVNRTQYTSIFSDENYKKALEYADVNQRALYEEEAKVIDNIQKGILAISEKEEPFDVFICYKESDSDGQRTIDSALATEIYQELTREGLKTFFARITLEDKLGEAYEPYIFSALNSARVMIVVGTKSEYLQAVWVKNEWSRFLGLIKSGVKKTLIPAYKNMDPYDMPVEFSHLQALDMEKLGFMQDLIKSVKNIIKPKKEENNTDLLIEDFINNKKHYVLDRKQHDSKCDIFVHQAMIALENGDFEKAKDFSENALDINNKSSEAYLVKLMIDLKVRRKQELAKLNNLFDENVNYKKIVILGNKEIVICLNDYLQIINARIEENNNRKKYNEACQTMARYTEKDLLVAIDIFKDLIHFKDSHDKIKECESQLLELRFEANQEKIYKCCCDDIYSSHNNKEIIKKIGGLMAIDDYKDSKDKICILIEELQAARFQPYSWVTLYFCIFCNYLLGRFYVDKLDFDSSVAFFLSLFLGMPIGMIVIICSNLDIKIKSLFLLDFSIYRNNADNIIEYLDDNLNSLLSKSYIPYRFVYSFVACFVTFTLLFFIFMDDRVNNLFYHLFFCAYLSFWISFISWVYSFVTNIFYNFLDKRDDETMEVLEFIKSKNKDSLLAWANRYFIDKKLK